MGSILSYSMMTIPGEHFRSIRPITWFKWDDPCISCQSNIFAFDDSETPFMWSLPTRKFSMTALKDIGGGESLQFEIGSFSQEIKTSVGVCT